MAELNFPGTIRSGAKENGVLVPIVYAEETFDKLLSKFQSAINSEFQTAIANLQKRKIVKVESSLPSEVTDEYKNVVILVPQAGGDSGNYFLEYIWNDTRNEFEQFGAIQTSVDLTDYYTKAQVDSKITTVNNNINALKGYTYNETTGTLTLTGFK